MSSLLTELTQDRLIPVVENVNVVDAVLEHGDTVEPGAEREPRPFVRVQPAVLDDAAVDHPAAENLNPAR